MLGAMFASPYYLDPTLDPSSDPIEITQRVAASRKDMHERRKGHGYHGGDMKEGEVSSTPPSHSRRGSIERGEEIAASPLLRNRSAHENSYADEPHHDDGSESIVEKRPTMHERRKSLDLHLAGGDALLLHTPDKAPSTSLFSHQLEMPYQLHSNDRKDESFTHSPSAPSSSTSSSLNFPSPSQSTSAQHGRESGIITNNNLPLVDLSSSAFTQLLSTGGKQLSKVCRQGFNSSQRQEVWPRILLYPSSVLSMDSSLYYRLVEIVFNLPRTSLTELIPGSEAEGFLDPELAASRMQQLQQSLPTVFPDAPSLGRRAKFEWEKFALERSEQSILAQRRILCVLASGLSSSTSQLANDGAPSTRTLFYYAPQLPALLSIVFHVFACDEVKTFVYMQAMLERSQRDEKFLFLSPISERIFTRRIFDRLLKKHQPDLWKHFHQTAGGVPVWDYYEWFQTHSQNLFLDSSLPVEAILRCCDLAINHGVSAFLKFTITLFGKFEMYLLSGEKEKEVTQKKLDHLFKVVNMDSLFGANTNAITGNTNSTSTATTASSSAASSNTSSTSTSPANLSRTIAEAVAGGPTTGWMSDQALFPHGELMKLSQQAEKDLPPLTFTKLQLERGTVPTVFHLPTLRGVGKVDNPQDEHILDVPLMYSLYEQAMEGHFPSNTHDPHLVFASWREGHSLRAMISAIQAEITASTAPAAHSVLVLIQFEERDQRLRSLHLNTNDDDEADGSNETKDTESTTKKKIVALFFDKFPIGSWNGASQLNADQEIEVSVQGRGFIATIGMSGGATTEGAEGEQLPIQIQQFEFPESENVLDEVVADVIHQEAAAVAATFGETNDTTIAEEGTTPEESVRPDATGEHEVASPVPNSLPILPIEGGPASLQPSPATSPMDSSNAPGKESLKRRGSIAKILDALHLKRFDDEEDEDEKKNDPNYELIKAALGQIPSLSPFKTAHIRVLDTNEADNDRTHHGRNMSSSSTDSRASSAPGSPSHLLSTKQTSLPLPLGSPGDSESLSSVKRIRSLFSFTPTGKTRSMDSPQLGGSVVSTPTSTRSISSSASNSRKSSIVAGLERVWSFIDSVPAGTTMSVPSSKVPSPVQSRKGSVSSTPMHQHAGGYGGNPRLQLPPLNASSPMVNTSAPGSGLSSPSRKAALPPAPFSTTSAAASHVASKLNQQRMARGALTSTNSNGRAPPFTRAASAAPTPQNHTPVRIRSMTSAGLGKNDQVDIQRHIESMRARERSWDSSAATLESATRRQRSSSNVVQPLPESKEEVEARSPEETNDTAEKTQQQPPTPAIENKTASAASLAPMSASHAYLQSLSSTAGTDSIVQTEAEQPKSDALPSPITPSALVATPSVGALTAAFRASQNPLQLRLDDLEPDAQPSHIQSVREALTRSRRRSLIRSRTSTNASQILLFDKDALVTESPTAEAETVDPATEEGILDESALLHAATPILNASAVFSNNAFILRIPSLKLLLSINSTLEEGLWQCEGMDESSESAANANVTDPTAASTAVDSSKSATTGSLESEKKYECASIEAWNFR